MEILGMQNKSASAACEDKKEIATINSNLEKTQKAVSKKIGDSFAGKGNEKTYSVDSSSEFKRKVKSMDISAKGYTQQISTLYKETSPEVIKKVICEQAEDASNAVRDIGKRKPDKTLSYTSSKGDNTYSNIYKLESGAEVIETGTDVEDTSYDVKGNDIFSQCSICTAKWTSDKNIHKKLGNRRYTTTFRLLIGGSVSTSEHWEHNETKLHKLYATVTVNRFVSDGAYLKQSGKCTFSR